MSQLKLTAVEGLKTQGDADSLWDDFYTNDKEQKPKKTGGSELAKISVENDTTYDDDFEDEDDDEDRHSRETPRINLNLNTSLTNTSTKKLDSESDSHSSSTKPRRKGKGKRFKTGANNKPPPLSLYHDQLRDRLQYPRSASHNQDTQSDQEARRHRGRKLHRRGQMKKYRSLEQAVELAGRDRLEQKYIELEELMTQPLVENTHSRAPASGQQWTSKKQKQPSRSRVKGGLKEEEEGGGAEPSRIKAWISNSTLDEDETTDRHAYTTLRKLQTTSSAAQKKNMSVNPHPAALPDNNNSHHPQQHNSKLASKPPVPRRRKISEDSLRSTSSETSHPRNGDDSKPRENGFEAHFLDENDDDDDDDKFGDVSPRSVYPPTDMHLKYTDNPKLQEWLKRKNEEHRQARKAEKVKKREERHQKQSEMEQRQTRREKSSERVKQWMDLKRKEAAKQQKEERRRRKQEAQEQAALRARNAAENGIRGSRVDHPQSAPPPNNKHTPIKRPESAARLDNGAYMAPKPPDTKFVYKRPVSGKVRLMKLQNEKKAKEAEQKRFEELSPEEKEKKTRMSYDAWLIAKRKEDTEKRKEVKWQEKLMKSNPEMNNLVPELAIRRIQEIGKAKKKIDTGVSVIDDEVNKRFGGGLFGKEDEKPSQKHDQDLSIPDPSSYSLTVEGSASTLAELNARARPTVSKTRMPIPQSTLSPRRSQSAKPSRDSSPKVRTIMDTDYMAEPNPFKLPFSGDFDTSLQIRGIQERMSTKSASSQPGDSQRPESQGCASLEPASCPKGVDDGRPKPDSFPKGLDSSPKPESTPGSSLVLLQQIEAAAAQSEQETKRGVHKENTLAASDQEPSNTGLDEEPEKLFITEPQSDHPLEGAKSQTEEKDVDKSVDHEQDQTQDDGSETITKKQQENASSEGSSGPETQEAVQEPLNPNTAKLDAKETEQPAENQPTSSQADSAEESAENLKASGQENTQVPEGAGAEDSPRRSMKRVSFSEDLTTVFQTSSPETSSNFDDERGADDEEEDPYMCLDNAPDPQ
ncbi:hypothetical protein ACOMHN_054991 [Nucella lapillus]